MKKNLWSFILFFSFFSLTHAVDVQAKFKEVVNSFDKSDYQKLKEKIDDYETYVQKNKNNDKKQKNILNEEKKLKDYLTKENKQDYTPIYFAIEKEDFQLVDKALKYGARIDVYAENKPILYWTLENHPNKYIVSSLLNCNAVVNGTIDVNETAKDGNLEKTCLQLVLESDELQSKKETLKDICNLLLGKGADPNKTSTVLDEDGKEWKFTPLHYVAKKNYSDLYTLLTKNGGDKNLKDSKGKSALDYKSEWIKNTADKLEYSYECYNSSEILLKDCGNDWEKYKGTFSEKTSSEKLNMAQIAIIHGDNEAAKFLLEKIDWNEKNKEGLNSLDLALQNNRDEIIQFLLEKKIKISESIFFVIDNALKNGNTYYLQEFLKAGEFANASKVFGDNNIPVDPVVYTAICNNAGQTAISAASSNRSNILELLTNEENISKFSKAGLNSKITKDGKTPGEITPEENSIIQLIKYGADLNVCDNAGLNIKDYAFKKNQIQVINYFKENNLKIGSSLFYAIENEISGHDSNIIDFIERETPQDLSKLTRKIQDDDDVNSFITCGLVAYTAYANSENKESSTNQSRMKILKKLIGSGLDINEVVKGGKCNGCTALIISAMNGHSEMVDFLLDNNADISLQNKSEEQAGRTALFYALENKHFDSVNSILKKMEYKLDDIQLNNQQDNNATLLMFIARYGDFDFVHSILSDFLARNKYSLEKTDKNGMTPFLYAATYNSDYRIMKLLRMYGANVFALDKNGKNAYELASENQAETPDRDEILRRIESYGVYGK